MTDHILSISALVIALIALFISLRNRQKRLKLRREFEAERSQARNLDNNGLELSYRNAITQSRFRLKIAMEEINDFKELHPDKDFKVKSKIFYSSLEFLYSQYEKACQLYIDDKIDRKKFEDEFGNDLVKLIRRGEHSEKYFWSRTQQYPAILKVYNSFTQDDSSPSEERNDDSGAPASETEQKI